MKNSVDSIVQKRTVLVVEDNEMNREILCELLMDDFDVVQAENGLVGLEQLDVYMPVCDGFGFLERKRASGKHDSVPVIVMTASGSVDDEIRCLELGATDFVTKPYNIEVLKNRLLSTIRLRESASMLNRLEMDELTGLYSKEFFYYNADRVRKAAPDARFDIVCSDVENFRAINERYGRQKSDQFLRELAVKIMAHLPGEMKPVGGRIGADIFAFLIEHQEGDWTDALRPIQEEGRSLHANVKYGVVKEIDNETPVPTLCDRATLAIREIKGNVKTVVSWFSEEMRNAQIREHQIVDNADAAIKNHEFQVYYQPKHSLETDHTGGAEALVRWIHPDMGFISPGAFIPLFERNGFITKLDFYIWEEVCQELSRCREQGLPMVPISVNVSRMDFDVPDLAGKIGELADKYGIDHSLLHIELTESIYGDNPGQIARTLEDLHNNGFIIELDDFGSGYSSLTSLNTLTLDVMKLDMSIIRQASATNNYSILRYAVLLAEGMRLKTVAEGVESEDQVAALKVLGCDYIQGYFYSKPLPGREFEAYLSAHAA